MADEGDTAPGPGDAVSRAPVAAQPAAESQRLDKWLWYCRLTKSRSLAGRLIEGGKIRVNGTKQLKPSATLKIGDVVTAVIARYLTVVKVLDGGKRRGPAEEARALYELLETDRPQPGDKTRAEREAEKMLDGKVGGPVRERGSGRPTKRERRKMDRFDDTARNERD